MLPEALINVELFHWFTYISSGSHSCHHNQIEMLHGLSNHPRGKPIHLQGFSLLSSIPFFESIGRNDTKKVALLRCTARKHEMSITSIESHTILDVTNFRVSHSYSNMLQLLLLFNAHLRFSSQKYLFSFTNSSQVLARLPTTNRIAFLTTNRVDSLRTNRVDFPSPNHHHLLFLFLFFHKSRQPYVQNQLLRFSTTFGQHASFTILTDSPFQLLPTLLLSSSTFLTLHMSKVPYTNILATTTAILYDYHFSFDSSRIWILVLTTISLC